MDHDNWQLPETHCSCVSLMCPQGSLLPFVFMPRPGTMELLTPKHLLTPECVGAEKTLRVARWFINAFIWNINTPLWHVLARASYLAAPVFVWWCSTALSVAGRTGNVSGSDNACPPPPSVGLRQASWGKPSFKLQSLWQIWLLTHNPPPHPPALPPFWQTWKMKCLTS